MEAAQAEYDRVASLLDKTDEGFVPFSEPLPEEYICMDKPWSIICSAMAVDMATLLEQTINKSIDRQAFQSCLTWSHYYSHCSHRRVGDTLEVRNWVTYHDAADVLSGSYSYPHTTCKYNAVTQHALEDGEIRAYPRRYKFTSA